MIVKPSLQNVWLADDVTRDAETGKATYTNVFDHIKVKRPLLAYVGACLIFGVRDVRGPVQLLLRYTDLRDFSIIWSRSITVECDDPFQVTLMAIRLPPMPVPHTGPYVWNIVWDENEDEIGSARLAAEVE